MTARKTQVQKAQISVPTPRPMGANFSVLGLTKDGSSLIIDR